MDITQTSSENRFVPGGAGDYDENGVDLSLLRWMLSMTPHERLLEMEKCARDTLELLEYGERYRKSQAGQHR